MNDHFEQSAATVLKAIADSQSEDDQEATDSEEEGATEANTNPNAAQYSTLADISLWSGDFSGALEHLKNAENPEDCNHYLQKGNGAICRQVAEAAAAFRR